MSGPTLSNLDTSIEAVSMGCGFAWYPEPQIHAVIAAGRLKPLPLREEQDRSVDIHMVLAEPDLAGPGVKRLAEIVREEVGGQCPVQS